MFTLNKWAGIAAIGTAIMFCGLGFSACADERAEHLGPVGPHEPIVTAMGSKGVIAFYEPDGTHCALYAVVYSLDDESGASGTQVRMRLNARQIINIDSPENESLSLQCGNYAELLKIVDPNTVVAAGPGR